MNVTVTVIGIVSSNVIVSTPIYWNGIMKGETYYSSGGGALVRSSERKTQPRALQEVYLFVRTGIEGNLGRLSFVTVIVHYAMEGGRRPSRGPDAVRLTSISGVLYDHPSRCLRVCNGRGAETIPWYRRSPVDFH